jgi:hypothetical protein
MNRIVNPNNTPGSSNTVPENEHASTTTNEANPKGTEFMVKASTVLMTRCRWGFQRSPSVFGWKLRYQPVREWTSEMISIVASHVWQHLKRSKRVKLNGTH